MSLVIPLNFANFSGFGWKTICCATPDICGIGAVGIGPVVDGVVNVAGMVVIIIVVGIVVVGVVIGLVVGLIVVGGVVVGVVVEVVAIL